ncbi:hypothetical protein BCR43DRAFT_498978 [Syncephalastrum racemosum]|uniref:Uncharacterized protein n=1 Tax=Syncephalastrum racemosum TaxID=13706 RepID=A0A1X2H1Y4_SYNRA|nr:hypothetical protein BCR43DRAFT_498978 [Syncephalastrum racemosum]
MPQPAGTSLALAAAIADDNGGRAEGRGESPKAVPEEAARGAAARRPIREAMANRSASHNDKSCTLNRKLELQRMDGDRICGM